VAVGLFDIGRALNYPDMFPKDAIEAGRLLRGLEETGAISRDGKILVERAADWGDLAIVALANRPARFVVVNEWAFGRSMAGSRLDDAAATPSNDDVRGTVCNGGFEVDACKRSVVRGGFDLVILSSADRSRSFAQAFHPRSWTIGRYEIFDMRSVTAAYYATRLDRAVGETALR